MLGIPVLSILCSFCKGFPCEFSLWRLVWALEGEAGVSADSFFRAVVAFFALGQQSYEALYGVM